MNYDDQDPEPSPTTSMGLPLFPKPCPICGAHERLVRDVYRIDHDMVAHGIVRENQQSAHLPSPGARPGHPPTEETPP